MKYRFDNDSRVAVFGGTFDPFTVSHRAICKKAMDEMPIDKLYIIPTIVSYHRDGKDRWLNDDERVECIWRMLWSLGPDYMGRWEVDTHELDFKFLCHKTDGLRTRGSGYTPLKDIVVEKRRFLDTLLDFRTRVGLDTVIDLILGTDSARHFHTWYRWIDIAANVKSIVIVDGRNGKPMITWPRQVAKELHNLLCGFCTMDLDDSSLQYVSASNVRSYYKKNNLSLGNYLDAVARHDRGDVVLEKIGWSEKKGDK